MVEAQIVDRGRGPEIAGTRITVYTVFEFLRSGWRSEDIAFSLGLRPEQVDAATAYIERHGEEVAAAYDRIMDRIERGNPPELQAKLDAAHERFQAEVQRRRRAAGREVAHAGDPGGQ